MLAADVYMERLKQVASILYRNICMTFGLETLRLKWGTPPKKVENRAKVQRDFQTDKQMMEN